MTVRRATVADMDLLLELARLEHVGSQFNHIRFDEYQAQSSFRRFITDMASAVFVSERGFIMGMVQPLLFSPRWLAYEVAWVALDGQGLALLKALEKWSKDMRALELVVHNYAGISDPQSFARVLKRKGFARLGDSFIKTVCGPVA